MDDLHPKTNDELNELFAVEVANLIREAAQCAAYCTDANAVLSFLETHDKIMITHAPIDDWFVSVRDGPEGCKWYGGIGTFARAAVLALIRIKRADQSS